MNTQNICNERRRVERSLLIVGITSLVTPIAGAAFLGAFRSYAGAPIFGFLDNPFFLVGGIGMLLIGAAMIFKLAAIRRTGNGWQSW